MAESDPGQWRGRNAAADPNWREGFVTSWPITTGGLGVDVTSQLTLHVVPREKGMSQPTPLGVPGEEGTSCQTPPRGPEKRGLHG